MKTNEIGVAGEVRCVVTKADGTVKIDTGYHKNLILNQGLDFFGGGKGSSINYSCAIGAGNSTPLITQTKLDSYISQANGTDTTSNYSYVDTGDGLYRMWEQNKYRFTPSSDINVSELGLVSTGTTSSNYYLTTRTLLKDSLGVPTTITVRIGETLDIYYKFHKVIDTTDKSFVINVLDGDGGAIPYNVVVRSSDVGVPSSNRVSSTVPDWNYSQTNLHTNDIAAKTSKPSGGTSDNNTVTFSPYVTGSYKLKAVSSLDLNKGNIAIRSYSAPSKFFPLQMRLGRVSDDAPLTKTNKDILSIPLEFSWGRYEGVL